MTRLELLKELEEQFQYNVRCYTKDIILGLPKDEYKKEFSEENEKLFIIRQMIKEERNKEKNKINER